jgi:Fic family protein
MISFMLQGFHQQAKYTKENLFAVMDLYNQYKEQIRTKYKKIYSSDLVEQLFSYPIITPIKLGKSLDIHYTTATRHLNQLVEGGFLEDIVQGKYHLYINKKLLKIINKE